MFCDNIYIINIAVNFKIINFCNSQFTMKNALIFNQYNIEINNIILYHFVKNNPSS
jgi:hypothetical protein